MREGGLSEEGALPQIKDGRWNSSTQFKKHYECSTV